MTVQQPINLQRQGDKWARSEDVEWFQLWLQYLRLSPSYELARKCRSGELAGTEALPADFDAVLAVYDDLGDVLVPRFLDWWRAVGIQHFGFTGEKPSPAFIGTIQHGGDNDVSDALANYMSREWEKQGEPTAVVAAIPVGLPKAQLLKWLDGIMPEQVRGRPAEPTYKLHKKKLHRRPMWLYVRVMLARAANPNMTLWQIGEKVKLSNTYSDQELRSQQRTYDQAGDRKNLKELTSRALKRGQMIAENAARGIFPLYANCPHAMPFNWAETHERSMNARTLERYNRAV